MCLAGALGRGICARQEIVTIFALPDGRRVGPEAGCRRFSKSNFLAFQAICTGCEKFFCESRDCRMGPVVQMVTISTGVETISLLGFATCIWQTLDRVAC
jgi:hypothetical protein